MPRSWKGQQNCRGWDLGQLRDAQVPSSVTRVEKLVLKAAPRHARLAWPLVMATAAAQVKLAEPKTGRRTSSLLLSLSAAARAIA
jgi:hypothetical protein